MQKIFEALGLDLNNQPAEESRPVKSLGIVEHKELNLGDCGDIYTSRNVIPAGNHIVLHVRQRHYLSPKNNFDRSEFIEDQLKLEKLILYLKENYKLEIFCADNFEGEFLKLLACARRRIETERKNQKHLPSDTWNLLLTYWNRISHKTMNLSKRNRAALLYFINRELNAEIERLRAMRDIFQSGETAILEDKYKKMLVNWAAAEIESKHILEKLEDALRKREKCELLTDDGSYFNMGAVLKLLIDEEINVNPIPNFGSLESENEIKKNQYVPVICGEPLEKAILAHNETADAIIGLIEIAPR